MLAKMLKNPLTLIGGGYKASNTLHWTGCGFGSHRNADLENLRIIIKKGYKCVEGF